MQHLARLKHPSVLRLVAPLEETRTQLVFLSEPVFASLGDLLQADQRRLPPQLAQVGAEGCVCGGGEIVPGGHCGEWGVRWWRLAALMQLRALCAVCCSCCGQRCGWVDALCSYLWVRFLSTLDAAAACRSAWSCGCLNWRSSTGFCRCRPKHPYFACDGRFL